MRISDIMSHMDLAVYPQIAMLIFMGVFAIAMVRTFSRPHAEIRRLAHLPMEDDPGHAPAGDDRHA